MACLALYRTLSDTVTQEAHNALIEKTFVRTINTQFIFLVAVYHFELGADMEIMSY